MSYCINGWDEEFDDRTGERYYRCHDCQRREGSGHDDDCSRMKKEDSDEQNTRNNN